MKAVLPALARPLIEAELPPDLDISWFTSRQEAEDMVRDAEIAWVDQEPAALAGEVALKGERLRWLSTMHAGLDAFPLRQLHRRGVTVTNGSGLNAITVSEYAVMGMLVAAKRFDEVVRLADRHEWSKAAPGRLELAGSSALIVGYGTIGRLIGARLSAFDVAVTAVTRSGRDGTLTPDQWRDRLGDFDWVVLAAPSTGETKAMIGAAELAAMKPSAWLVNIARGDMIDNPALIAALKAGDIAGAFLDTVHPEPLPADDPLWSAPNTIHSMHLSGRSQTTMVPRAARLFLKNLAAYRAGQPLTNVVDLDAGY